MVVLSFLIMLIVSNPIPEPQGVDALMMIAHAGLNPMANRCKAGCPVRNIQATLDALTHAGLSVAGFKVCFLTFHLLCDFYCFSVYEEIAEVDTGKGRHSPKVTKAKERELYQIVSPASSLYTNNLCLRPDDIEFQESKPAVGIMRTAASGFTMCEIYLDEKVLSLRANLAIMHVNDLDLCAEIRGVFSLDGGGRSLNSGHLRLHRTPVCAAE